MNWKNAQQAGLSSLITAALIAVGITGFQLPIQFIPIVICIGVIGFITGLCINISTHHVPLLAGIVVAIVSTFLFVMFVVSNI